MEPSDPQPLSRSETLRGLEISIWEGAWATVYMVLTAGAFLTGFALMLGASPFALGLMAGLPAVIGLLQVPASLWIGGRWSRRQIVAWNALVSRLLFIPILLIPFVLPSQIRLGAFLLLLVISATLSAVIGPAWTSWMSDLAPASSRGQYFGRRNMIAGIVTMLAPLPAGAFLDQAVKQHRFDPRLGFAVLFGIGVAASLVSFALLLRQPEPPIISPRPANPLKSLTAPLSDANFRRFLLFGSLIACGQNLAAPFFIVWQLNVGKGLAQSYLTVQALSAISAATGLAAMPAIGYLSDRFGSRPVLTLSTLIVILPPLIWMFTTPGARQLNIALIVLLNLISGVGWAGVGLTQFNLLLAAAAPATRATYIALFSAFTGFMGGVAPILGGILLGVLANVELPAGPLRLDNFRILFLISAIIRAASLWPLVRVHEAESRSTRFVAEQIVNPRLVNSFRVLQRLRQPLKERDRRAAIETLASLRAPLAASELIPLLDDVSPAVRDSAVRALGAIGDPGALPALIAKLSDAAAGVEVAAANALGQIGASEAATALARAATAPDAAGRDAALRALARIPGALKSSEAQNALIAALSGGSDAAREAACDALSAHGELLPVRLTREALPGLIFLLAPTTGRDIRAAAARALCAIAGPGAAGRSDYDALAAPMKLERDASVLSLECLALSRIGAAAAVPAEIVAAAILEALERPGMAGLAGKQALLALGDAVLPSGLFYPHFGLTEGERDTVFAQLLAELERIHARSRQPSPFAALQTLPALFAAGDYAAFISVIASSAPADDGPQALALRALARIPAGDRAPETALLCLLLVRETGLNDQSAHGLGAKPVFNRGLTKS